MSKIDEFRSKLIDGGHRSNRFRVSITFPTDIESASRESAQSSFEFLAHKASMPRQSLSEVDVAYKGRVVKFAGDIEKPDDWSCTVYNTTSFDVRNAILEWRNSYMPADSVTSQNLISLSNATIEMLDKNDKVLQRATLMNAWPKTIGEISLEWGDSAGISTFDLTLTCDYIVEEPVKESTSTIETAE